MGAENFTTVKEFILVGLTSHRQTQIGFFVVILIMYWLTVLGNLVVIMLVWFDSQLHTPMYFFLTHFSVLEICYVTSTVPQMLAHLMAGNGAISFTHCIAQMYFSTVMGGTECFLLAAMAYDRYLAICHPLVYAILMGRWCRWQLASGSWAICFLIAALNMSSILYHPICGFNHINHFFCEMPLVMKLMCGDTSVTEAIFVWTSVLVILVPLCIVLTSYGLILLSVLKMRSTAGWRKAFSTCGSHLAVVTLFYGTLIFMYLIPQSGAAPDRDKQISVFYTVVTPLINPIIYTLRNKDIHGAVAKVLQRWGLKHKR